MTYEKLQSPLATVGASAGASSSTKILTDFVGLECMMRYTGEGNHGCISTAFWLALAQPAVLKFFERVLFESLHGVWEQKAFNTLLPNLLRTESPGTVVVLDPALFGNVDAQNCAQAARNTSRFLTHGGYRYTAPHQEPSKYGALRDCGIWYLPLYN